MNGDSPCLSRIWRSRALGIGQGKIIAARRDTSIHKTSGSALGNLDSICVFTVVKYFLLVVATELIVSCQSTRCLPNRILIMS